jgi:hypothetical protein
MASADHYYGDCPLSLVDSTPPLQDFDLSPHGVFRDGNTVYVLRGQVLATYTSNDTGNLTIARADVLEDMGARETNGGVTYGDGFLYVSSEYGLEIWNLTNTHAGGVAPQQVSVTPGVHYRRMTVDGNRLAGLYPATDLPCYPLGSSTPLCVNQIEILDVTNRAAPVLVGVVQSKSRSEYRGLNDIAFNQGYLLAASEEGLSAIDISNPASPIRFAFAPFPGQWLVTNGTVVGIGTDTHINMFNVRPGMSPFFVRTALLTIPEYLSIDLSNPIRFNRHAYWDEQNARLITLIEEVDPMTLEAARTVAFDVFDLTVIQFEGSVERIYEDVTLVQEDEVKHNPVAVGPFVYVIGEETGLQSYGACGQISGRIELEGPHHLTCNGTFIRGWVTGVQRVESVELFLDNTPLGRAQFSPVQRWDVSSRTPVTAWSVPVNLDATPRGEYQLRAIGTDSLDRRRQFASKRIFFEGPGENCRTPKRRSVR